MELRIMNFGTVENQVDIQSKLRDKLSTIYLGDVMNIWEDQRQICTGSHAEFAKHLLALHKECCFDYCQAESQEKAAVLLCNDNHCTHQANNSQIFK